MADPAEQGGADKRNAAERGVWSINPKIAAALLALAAFAVLYPAINHDYINLDDPSYVSSNPHVQSGFKGSNLLWAFQVGYAGNWHPLTWISHMLDAQLFPASAWGGHLVNLLLHIANTVLLFVLFLRLTGHAARSLVVAALFALHPAHIESMAWISERKDVLSAFFFFLTLLSYQKYTATTLAREFVQPASGDRWRRLVGSSPYICTLLFFVAGLLSKPMLVTMPIILLLLDYWPLKRAEVSGETGIVKTWLWLLVEKTPFILLSAASSLVTFVAQHRGGAVQSLSHLSLTARIQNVLVAYLRYLGELVWPVDLAIPYPPVAHWPIWLVLTAVLVLAGLTLGAIWQTRRSPFLLFGWLWFVVMLVPVIGLVQVGEQSLADRYTYLPSIGLFVALTWLAGEMLERLRVPQVFAWSATGCLLVVCAGLSRVQLAYWKNSETLYRHTLGVTHHNWEAAYNLGWHLDSIGRFDDALAFYRQAMQWAPQNTDPLNNMGIVYVKQKKYDEAGKAFDAVLKVHPNSIDARNNLAGVLREQGRINDAAAQFQAVLKQQPQDPGACLGLATILAEQRNFAAALPYYEVAARQKPDDAVIQYSLANTLSRLGRREEAMAHYQLAVQYRPDFAEAQNDLGLALTGQGKAAEATPHFRAAVKAQPGNPRLLVNLARALAMQRNFDEALPLFNQALKISPTNVTARANLAVALANKGDFDQAVAQLREALRYRPNDFSLHFDLGRIFVSQGKPEEARQQFNEALRLKPDFTPARQALQALPGH